MYFYKARFYDPALGRFVQADTLVPNQFNPQDLNRYAYALNNPVRFNDPTGHVCTDPEDPNPTCYGSGTTRVGNRIIRGNGAELGEAKNLAKSKRPNNGCQTVTCRAFEDDVLAILDLFFPTHWGWRWQLEGAGSIPFAEFFGIGPSGTLGINVAYNRKSEELAAFMDITGEGGVSAGSPLGASVTTGPLVGWASSTVKDVATGDSAILSVTVAPDLAVSLAGNAPLDGYNVSEPLDFENVSLHVDPVYGQVPATLYGGGGLGAYYAGGGGGTSHVFASGIIDLSPYLPWNWQP